MARRHQARQARPKCSTPHRRPISETNLNHGIADIAAGATNLGEDEVFIAGSNALTVDVAEQLLFGPLSIAFANLGDLDDRSSKLPWSDASYGATSTCPGPVRLVSTCIDADVDEVTAKRPSASFCFGDSISISQGLS